MSTDVYPRENCIAPNYASTQYDYPPRERYCTQEGHMRDGGGRGQGCMVAMPR